MAFGGRRRIEILDQTVRRQTREHAIERADLEPYAFLALDGLCNAVCVAGRLGEAEQQLKIVGRERQPLPRIAHRTPLDGRTLLGDYMSSTDIQERDGSSVSRPP